MFVQTNLQPLKESAKLSNPPAQSKSKIIIVEDHPLFRERLAVLINQEPDMIVSGEADNIHQAMEIIQSVQPDAVIVDITLKGASGLELIKNLKTRHPDLPTLVLSMHDESLYAERAIRAGARGYITKNESADKVMLAIRKVLGGETYLLGTVTSQILKNLAEPEDAQEGLPVHRLTDRELEVFQLIGKGKSNREIAKILKLGQTTVETYRARIKEKLNLKSTAELHYEAIQWQKNKA